MTALIEKIRRNKFLTLICSVYIILFILAPEKGIKSFFNSLYYVKEMLIIMPVVLLLTSLIEAWVPKKTIENALGENSGAKGFLFSFLLGSFSAGPIYAAFPVCKTLINKGASVANIIIILSAWAVIKIPMLANEAKFLGPVFMTTRWILTTISIVVMALITSKIVKREDIEDINDNETSSDENLQLSVDDKFCVGCSLCTRLAKDNFIMVNSKAKINKHIYKADENEEIIAAINKCPAKAIKYI